MATKHGKITEDGLKNLRARIGSYYKGGQGIRQITVDEIRHYVLGHGERNPLYIDPEYGKGTRYGSLIAAPLYLNEIKHTSGTPVGGLPGVQSFHGGNDWELFHAVYPGDRIGATYRPVDVVEKPSTYAGRMVIVYIEAIYKNQKDIVVGKSIGWSIRTERGAAQERGKYREIEKPQYTREQLEAIWEAVDQVEIRGSTLRYWEDVNVGDEFGPVVKGPLRIIDIAFTGRGPGAPVGAGALTEGAHWYPFSEYRRHAGYSEPDPVTGIADHPHRGHWESAFASLIAVPGAYDWGPSREAWMAQLLTNWMGDEAWIRRLYAEMRRFNVEGDTTWIRGKVTKKWIEGQQHLVACDIWCENQRSEQTAPGSAEVVLPSRGRSYTVPR